MTFAVIEDGKVANVVDAPAGFDGVAIDGLDPAPGIGWGYDGETFTALAPALAPRMITVYAFRTRFSTDEKRAIYTAAASNVDIKIWLDDLASVKDKLVDLNLQATIDGVNALEAVGLIGAGRAAQILEV